MSLQNFPNLKNLPLLLEAEVPPASQPSFEKQYKTTTGIEVNPSNPPSYQNQPNKWAAELRVYFNDDDFYKFLQEEKKEIDVEFPRNGYKSGQYKYRFNNNNLWWELVQIGLRLGSNP